MKSATEPFRPSNCARLAFAASAALVAAGCASAAKPEAPPPSSLDATLGYVIERINATTTIHVQMGDKLVTQKTLVSRSGPCELAVRDKKHSELGSVSEESDVQATIDLRSINPRIERKEFTGSGLNGELLTLSSVGGRSGIRQHVERASSTLGLQHGEGDSDRFEFTITDRAAAERIAEALGHAVDLCAGR